MNITEENIIEKLGEVMDPEIPTLSVVDLGVIVGVSITDDNVKVTMTPTFAGCPAIDVMKEGIKNKVGELGVKNIEVDVTFEKKWTSDSITARGRQILSEAKFALPELDNGIFQIGLLTNVKCPNCESKDTRLQTPFGPTLCRAIHYCDNCKQSFEQFKPVE